MELVISVNVDDNAARDEVDYALREAARLAGRVVFSKGIPLVDEQHVIGGDLVANVACARGCVFYRSE